MKTQFPNSSRRSHRSAAGTPWSQASEGSQVSEQPRLPELGRDDPGVGFPGDAGKPISRRLFESTESLSELVDPVLLLRIAPIQVLARLLQPARQSLELGHQSFGEFWTCLPDLLQGPLTWLAFMGRLRSVLREALDADPARTGAAAAHAGESDRTPAQTGPPPADPSLGGVERWNENYRVKEVATRWGVDRKTVQRRFQHEEGVRHLKTKARKGHARERCTLLIPVHVLQRVERAMTRQGIRDKS